MPRLKHSPHKRFSADLVAQTLKPSRAVSSWWYRFYGWSSPPVRNLPPPVLEAVLSKDDMFKRISFTFSVIALSARVACSGGLTKEKYSAFRAAFPLSGGICGKIRALFSLACNNNQTPYEHYATQIKGAFPQQLPLFISLVDRLFCIATANGTLARETEHMLARVAHVLGLSAPEYSAIRERYMNTPTAHQVLGVKKRTPLAKLKQRYRELMRIYHPDQFATEDLSPEVALLLRLKASEINAAYHALTRRAA